jgi:subtilisin family serine protease
MNRGLYALARAAVCIGLVLLIVSCEGNTSPQSWLNNLYAEGRKMFYQTIREELSGHPMRSSLTEGEAAKIREAEIRYDRLYELLVNVFYQKDEPVFTSLISQGNKASRKKFAGMYRSVVNQAAHSFVEAFFATDAATEKMRKMIAKYKDLDAVDLVVRSIGYYAKLDKPDANAPVKPLNPEFEKQGALDGAAFRAAHQFTRGKGAKIAILDTGIDMGHPVFWNTQWGPHFSLVGRMGPPWESAAPLVDWGFHGTLISSVAAIFAPEARLTMYKFGDGDTQNDPPFGYLMDCLVAASIYRAVHDGNDIINISASGGTLDVPYLKEACRYAYDQNRVVICGNLYMRWYEMGNTHNFPAQYDSVVSVTAAERRKDGTYGYWNVCAPDKTVDVAAPNDVFGAFPTYVGREDSYIPSISAAIPVVASLFALIVSEYPRTGREAPGAYAQSLIDLVLRSTDPHKVGYEGFTPECGYGLIDAEKAVRRAQALRLKRDTKE